MCGDVSRRREHLSKIDFPSGRSTLIHCFIFVFWQSIDTTQVAEQTSQNDNVHNEPADKEVSSDGMF